MDDATKEDLLDILNEKQEEIEWLKAELDEANHSRELSDADCVTLRKERDEARRLCHHQGKAGSYFRIGKQRHQEDRTVGQGDDYIQCTCLPMRESEVWLLLHGLCIYGHHRSNLQVSAEAH